MFGKFAIAVLAAALFALTAYAGGSASVHNAGFLADYSKLQPVDGVDGTYRYIDTTVNLRPYKKVMVDPVQVFVVQSADYQGIQPDAMKRLTDAFRMEFVGALLSGYQVVNQPGPDVLRIRLAITGVQPTSTPFEATDFIPIKAIFNVARGAAGEAPRVAEMTAEMEILDPKGLVVAAGVSTRKGDKTLPQGERITWSELQVIVAAWAKSLRGNLDQLRGYAGQ